MLLRFAGPITSFLGILFLGPCLPRVSGLDEIATCEAQFFTRHIEFYVLQVL